ncbi:MAG: CubicO group peptidase (beta-lactamase class C family) [Saprospiraceae bacterium]|jgi:CubicO group peptidase (beta-lactamase class C family)
MKNSNLYFILFISSLLLFSSCDKEDIVINNEEDFEAFIQDEMEFQKIPALSMLIFENDNILYENHSGKSNIEQDISLEDDHLFLLASVSKVVTGIALLQLNEDGLFSLDDAINDYLSFNVNIPNITTSITFRMLLTHTSGIADGSALDDQYYYGEDSPVELSFFLENYLVPSGEFYNEGENFHNFEPGTKHEYSNIGTALVGLLVQEISGIDFNEYCKQNIFSPLEMTNTAWRLDEITQTIVQPYDEVNGENEVIEHYTFTDYPNGGLRSTANDMFKLLSALAMEGTRNDFQLLKAETVSEMITPQIPSLANDMGLQLFQMNAANNLWGHDGGEQGAATIMAFNPTTKIGAIVLANQGEADLEEILEEAYKFGFGL